MEQVKGIEKKEVIGYIHSLMNNLTTIKDQSGEYLLHFDGLIVDDKS